MTVEKTLLYEKGEAKMKDKEKKQEIWREKVDDFHEGAEYLKKWLEWVCKSYPNRYMPLFIGEIHPNAVGIVICNIFSLLRYIYVLEPPCF